MNYTQLAQNAAKQLAAYGQQITVVRYAPTRLASTGAVSKGTATASGTASAVEVPVTQGLIESFTVRLEDNALTAKTVRAFKVSALLGFQPTPRDEVTLPDGSVWPVVGCTPISPAGTSLVYTVGVAK